MTFTRPPRMRVLCVVAVAVCITGGSPLHNTSTALASLEPTIVLESPAIAAARVVAEPPVSVVPADVGPIEAEENGGEPAADEENTIYRICRVTAYCDRGTTASGVQSGVGQCAAPGDIPFGSTIYIPSLDRTLVVTDRTHRRFRNSTVDIFMPTREECLQFGCNYLECEIKIAE